MSKRVAEKELTDRNWQDEDEPEEAGVFTKATDDIIKQRVIKTARRRNPPPSNNGDKPSLFSGFAGFGAAKSLNIQPSTTFPKINATNGDTKPLFSFGAKADALSKPTFTFGAKPAESSSDLKPTFSFGAKAEQPKVESTSDVKTTESNESNVEASVTVPTPSTSEAASKSTDNNNDNNNEVFLRRLKKLNTSVLKFAQEHVDKNPFIILTTVFNDYEKHLKKIQSETSPQSATPEFKLSQTEQTPTKVDSSTKKEEKSPEPSKPAESLEKPSNPFGSSTTTSAFSNTAAPKFSFGGTGSGFSFKPTTSAADSTQSSGGFSFKPAAGAPAPGTSLFGKPVTSSGTFSGFGGLVGKPADSTETKEEEEAEEPPKPEKVEHVEKEALYHIKCKLFLKAGESWNEKGIGIANLKECNGKVQLLIRNDTTMGTIILNTLLHEAMPINKSGKNGLLIVATKEDSTTETYLCRVNKDKVDEFYDKLSEYKKGAPSSSE